MKYNYKVEITENNGKKQFLFRIPDEIGIVGVLFNYDLQTVEIGQRILNYCLNVLKGKVDMEEIGSDSCSTTIKPDYVEIIHRYSEENNICIIETLEFKLLLEAYLEEKRKYLKSMV